MYTYDSISGQNRYKYWVGIVLYWLQISLQNVDVDAEEKEGGQQLMSFTVTKSSF